MFHSCYKSTNCIWGDTGYTIPKGWKALVWFRSVHLDPEIYPNPKEFNPYRWNVSCQDSFLTNLNRVHVFCTCIYSLSFNFQFGDVDS